MITVTYKRDHFGGRGGSSKGQKSTYDREIFEQPLIIWEDRYLMVMPHIFYPVYIPLSLPLTQSKIKREKRRTVGQNWFFGGKTSYLPQARLGRSIKVINALLYH